MSFWKMTVDAGLKIPMGSSGKGKSTGSSQAMKQQTRTIPTPATRSRGRGLTIIGLVEREGQYRLGRR
jgi:hypothetical protein